MGINGRFVQFLGMKQLNQKKFSEKTGFPKYSLSKIITGSTKFPKADFIMILMKHFPELNLRWLLLGEGEMFNENIQPVNTTLHEEVIQLKDEISRLKDKIITLLEKE